MKLTRLFQYTKPVVPYRCHLPVDVVFTSEVTVNIREVTRAQAPLALIQVTREYFDTGLEDPTAESWKKEEDRHFWTYRPRRIGYRFFAGKLWTKTDTTEFGRRSERTTYQLEYPTPEKPSQHYHYGQKRWDDKTHDPKEKRIADIQEWAKDHLIIDGELYRTADEPRYTIYTFGLGGGHGSICISVDYHYNSNLSWKQYFRLDQYDEAVKEMTRIADRRRDKTRSLPEDQFTILIPKAIKLNPKRWANGGDEFQPHGKLGKLTELGDPVAAGLLMMASVFGGR